MLIIGSSLECVTIGASARSANYSSPATDSILGRRPVDGYD